MAKVFHADGDRWRITSATSEQADDVRTVVFHCVSNSNRPYRVVQVPESVLQTPDITRASEDELTDLFNRSHTMDYSHDAAAHPNGHGVDFNG